MSRVSRLLCVAFLLAGSPVALGQTSADFEALKKELELLKKEVDLLKRENDLLKKENDSLKKGGGSSSSGGSTDKGEKGEKGEKSVTVDDVEYVYLGSERKGAAFIVTVLATSKNGDHPGPQGAMTIIDTDGEKYTGHPVIKGGRATLKEGVPIKLSWQFGFNNFTGAARGGAPGSKVTRFAAVVIQYRLIGGENENTIDFKDVPAVVTKPKGK